MTAIKECFEKFNAKGGAVVPLQNGTTMYFARACTLASYADHPAAVKCTMTGSACSQCYTKKKDMAMPPLHGSFELRTDENMIARKRTYNVKMQSNIPATRNLAKKNAREEGVDLRGLNSFVLTADYRHKWIFGLDPTLDCCFQATPQVSLHGMDEGIMAKICRGLIEFAIRCSNRSPTKVSQP